MPADAPERETAYFGRIDDPHPMPVVSETVNEVILALRRTHPPTGPLLSHTTKPEALGHTCALATHRTMTGHCR
jgi:hypothetical protein